MTATAQLAVLVRHVCTGSADPAETGGLLTADYPQTQPTTKLHERRHSLRALHLTCEYNYTKVQPSLHSPRKFTALINSTYT